MQNLKAIVIVAIVSIILVFGLSLLYHRLLDKKPTKDDAKEQALIRQFDSTKLVIAHLEDSLGAANYTITSLNNLSNLLMEKYKSQKDAITKNDSRLVVKNNAVDTFNSVELANALAARYK